MSLLILLFFCVLIQFSSYYQQNKFQEFVNIVIYVCFAGQRRAASWGAYKEENGYS